MDEKNYCDSLFVQGRSLGSVCAAEIGVEDGEIIASSKGLHIYDYSFDLAKCLRMRDDMQLKQGD